MGRLFDPASDDKYICIYIVVNLQKAMSFSLQCPLAWFKRSEKVDGTHEIPQSSETWDVVLFASLHYFRVSNVIRSDKNNCGEFSIQVLKFRKSFEDSPSAFQ